jgi:hypothetical protein
MYQQMATFVRIRGMNSFGDSEHNGIDFQQFSVRGLLIIDAVAPPSGLWLPSRTQ